MKISASIYSNKEKDMISLVRELDAHRIDMLHIDCFDESVFEDIARIREISKTPIDLHIIHPEPENFFGKIQKLGIEYVSIQYDKKMAIPTLPKKGKTQWGLAIVTGDPLTAFSKAKQDFDFVLFMASAPGISGKPFNKSTFQRIIEFRQQYPKKKIQVDGGVNDRIAFILRLLGVNSIVSGNYLLNREYLGEGLLGLHKAPRASALDDFSIEDFMVPAKYLPVLDKKELNLKRVLETIEKFALGFVLVTEGKQKLHGIISNADLRRGFLRQLNDLKNVDVTGMVNTHPVSIGQSQTLTDMLHLLNDLNFIILFLPVVDNGNRLKGAVLLNNLTRV